MNQEFIIILLILVLNVFAGNYANNILKNVEAKYKDIYKNQMIKVDIILVIIGVIIIAGFIYFTFNPAIVEKIPFLTIIFNSVSCLIIFCVEILIRILMALRTRQLYGKN